MAKRFIDCGGTLHDTRNTCLLQTYVAGDVDHRLDAETFVKILDLGKAILPDDDLDVEVEYDCCVTAQYPIASAHVSGEHLVFKLEARHTDCLAKEKCGIESGCAPASEAILRVSGWRFIDPIVGAAIGCYIVKEACEIFSNARGARSEAGALPVLR